MMRPVRYLLNGKVDHVGTFEQVYMDIACTPQEIEKGLSTHVEIAPTNVLSVIANLTPFSDFNQSPRNMYQVSALWLVKRLEAHPTCVSDVDSVKWVSNPWVHRLLP
jgi:DNA-directed RNA polymerase I subunit RPA2